MLTSSGQRLLTEIPSADFFRDGASGFPTCIDPNAARRATKAARIDAQLAS
jgi:hypothetical protein